MSVKVESFSPKVALESKADLGDSERFQVREESLLQRPRGCLQGSDVGGKASRDGGERVIASAVEMLSSSSFRCSELSDHHQLEMLWVSSNTQKANGSGSWSS